MGEGTSCIREYFIADHIFGKIQKTITMKKGRQIRFIGGKYGGKKGWINDGKKGEKAMYVFDNSVDNEPTGTPSSYGDAILLQCPDLDCSLTKLCWDFAKCNIKVDPGPSGTMPIIGAPASNSRSKLRLFALTLCIMHVHHNLL
jgi:hypothetical protein